MYEEFRKAAEAILETAHCKDMLIRNPDAADLKALAMEEPEVRQTKYGSICAYSEPMSRAAKFTLNNVDATFGQAERELLEQAKRVLAQEEIVAIDVQVGDGTEGISARLIVPRRRPRGLRRAEALQANRDRQPDLPGCHVLRRGAREQPFQAAPAERHLDPPGACVRWPYGQDRPQQQLLR